MKMRQWVILLSVFLIISCKNSVVNDTANTNENSKKINISVQLYSVRDDLKNDFEGTLKKLSEIGFKGIEFAGNYGDYRKKPEALKQLLDKLNLGVAGAHFRIEKLRGEELNENIAFAKAIGCEYLIVSWDDRVLDKEAIKEFAKELNQLAVKLEHHGLKTGYHNHDDEMKEIDGVTQWDRLATLTNNNVILQQDVGWTTYAGKNPVYYVNKYPGRTLSTHYKAKLPKDTKNKLPIIGQDTIDWHALLQANLKNGGTKWYSIEQEDYPDGMTPMQSVEASYKGLLLVIRDLGYTL